MTGAQTKKFLEAINKAGIESYEFDTDLVSHLYHNDNAIIKFVEEDEMIYNIRSMNYTGSHHPYQGNIQVVAAWTEDVHEARTAGNYEQIKTFLEALGATFTDSDTKIMLNIEKKNSDIIPATGDYNRFVPLTKKQYDALSDEKKEEYDAAKEKADKAAHDYIGQNSAVSISLY